MGTRDKKNRRILDIPQGTDSSRTNAFIQASYHRSSILPPPNELERYEALNPGTTKTILESFQKQVDHRIAIERAVIEGDTKRANNGQTMAFIIVVLVLSAGFSLVFLGKDVIGISTVVASLATLLGAFLYGTHSRRKERERKAKL